MAKKPTPKSSTRRAMTTAAPPMPVIGRVTLPRMQDIVTQGGVQITPEYIRASLAMAASGYPMQQNQLIDRAVESDPGWSVYETRILATAGKQWDVTANPNAKDQSLAEEIAEFCRETLRAIPTLDDTIRHLLDAIGMSYSVAENVFTVIGGKYVLTDIVPVNHNAVYADPSRPTRLRVWPRDANGNSIGVDNFPFKFVTHIPAPISGSPFRGGLKCKMLPIHGVRMYGLTWWATATEMFGTPYRVMKYQPNATSDQKTEMLSALENFGATAYALMPSIAEFDLVEGTKGASQWPQPMLIEAIDTWYAIQCLGQTLTTKMDASGGSFAAAQVHQGVADDRMRNDVRKFSATFTQGVIRPLTILNYGYGAPVPVFSHVIEEQKDLLAISQTLDAAVNKLGMDIESGWAYESLGIPLPDGKDPKEPLKGAPKPVAPMGGNDPTLLSLARSRKASWR